MHLIKTDDMAYVWIMIIYQGFVAHLWCNFQDVWQKVEENLLKDLIVNQ